jgi:Domain of unknown function (DUF4386)
LSTFDSRSRAKLAAGLCLIVGPALLLVANLITPDTDRDNKLKELSLVAQHKSSYIVSILLFLAASFVLIAAAICVIRIFRGSKLGQTAGWLLALGSAVGVGWYTLGVVEYEMATQKGVDRAAMATLLHKADSPAGLIPLIVVFAAGIVVGSILLAIAARRQRLIPLWASIALVLSGVLGFAGNNSDVASIVSAAVLLVGLGALGVRVIQMSDADWNAAGPHPLSGADGVPAEPAPAAAG